MGSKENITEQKEALKGRYAFTSKGWGEGHYRLRTQKSDVDSMVVRSDRGEGGIRLQLWVS